MTDAREKLRRDLLALRYLDALDRGDLEAIDEVWKLSVDDRDLALSLCELSAGLLEEQSFNLIDDGWIPVLYANGRFMRVGIKTALTEAGRIRQIAASNPMDRVAILRFLLAVLYWCKGNPSDSQSTDSGDSFPEEWFSKLDDNNDCFNLLGSGTRFYQDGSARRRRPATDLIQEVPTGHNFWHFRHSADKRNGLCRACCALGLLRLPLFSVSGLPDLRAGINGTPPIYVLQNSTTLLNTLRGNWRAHESLGEPAWIRRNFRPASDQRVPLLTGLTLLSRRVWLHEPSDPPGVCIACGREESTLIRTCEFQTAGKQDNLLWDDPHVVYLATTPRKALRAPDLTASGTFRMDRPWPDLLARITEIGELRSGGKPAALFVVGFATDQAKNIDVWERTIEMQIPTQGQPAPAFTILQWKKEGARLIPSLARKSQRSDKKRSSRKDVKNIQIPPMIASIRPQVEDKVSARVGELLAGGDAAWERAALEYRPMMEMIAKSLSPGFTTAALKRRQEIATVLPDMRPRTTSAGKSARRKERNK